MAPPFVFTQTLTSLEDDKDDSNSSRLTVQNVFPTTSLRDAELEEFVKGVAFDLSDNEVFCIEEQEIFDRVYSLVKGFGSLSSGCKFNLVESLRSNMCVLLPNVDSLFRSRGSFPIDGGQDAGDDQFLVDRVASHRNAFKIYTFFLMHILLVSESSSNSVNGTTKVMPSSKKKQSVNSWNWESQRGRILNLIANSLEINLSMLFGSSDPDENYLSFIMKYAFLMFENALLLKDPDSKQALCRIVGTCATKYHYVSQASVSIMHLIHKHDFVVTHLADCIAGAEKKYADGSLAISLIREIGRTNPKDYVKDTVGAENIGRFLVELADRLPKLFSTNLGLLVQHLGGESYKIRNALVGVLGKLIAKAFSDVGGEISSKSTRLRAKQAMLEILLERCRDVSAYTRSRVLQVWADLCEEHSVSIGLWNEVATVASGRLEDKSAIVRKSALNLLIMMLQHNPFGPQLRAASFEATLEKYKEKLSELAPKPSPQCSDSQLPEAEVSCADSEADEQEFERNVESQDSLTDSCVASMENGVLPSEDSVPDVGNREQTRALVSSLEAGLTFSKCISATMPTLVHLMASPTSSDVENTILLLMRCRQFQVDGSEACLRKMLPLVFSQDKSVYEAVENAFISIYMKANPVESAKNLLNLAIDSNIGDLTALEFILGALVSKGDITAGMLAALWDFFCFNISGTTAQQSRGSLSVLCMAAKFSPQILSSHLQHIIDIGFGRWAAVEPLLARTACLALQRLSEDDRKKLLSTNGNHVFGILIGLICGSSLPDHIWYATADKALSALYAVHPTPEIVAVDLVKRLLKSAFPSVEGSDILNNTDFLINVQISKLSRYLFVIGGIAMNHLVYIESSVRKIQKERSRKGHIPVGESSTDGCNQTKDDSLSAEIGLAPSEDTLLDNLAGRTEKEIVSGDCAEKNLIGFCAPFLSMLCRNFSLMQKYPQLQASGMYALCCLMIVDAEFCEANLQLLFTVVENSKSETVRSNCTIALGDLAARFPNLLDPWTENMYARLQDHSVHVRKNAVLVLSHLILNDMMKVKGYINEMALRLQDEDDRISSLARLFFHELSKKGSNPIYNLLPDILGKLSCQNLDGDTFCNIMQFLMGSIKKDKQMESLVEKLCNRFSGVSDVRQWENISYCLSLLAFTDRSMKTLMELFKTYEHVLSEVTVVDHFRNIISKAKKFAKAEQKANIEEFELKINKHHEERKEQTAAEKNVRAHQQKMDRLGVFNAALVKKEEAAAEEEESCDVSQVTEDEKESSNSAKQERKTVTRKSKTRSVTAGSSSQLTEEEAPDEEDEVQSPLRGVTKSNMKKSCLKSRNETSTRRKRPGKII